MNTNDYTTRSIWENRRESADFSPDSFYVDQLGQTQIGAVAGSYITNEGYIETLFPIFSPAQDIPALNRLSIPPSA
jgi:hypothetical protein